MNAITCRDCGNMLDPSSRGCPKCALNLEAENMIDHFIWRRFLPAIVIAAIALAAVLFYVAR